MAYMNSLCFWTISISLLSSLISTSPLPLPQQRKLHNSSLFTTHQHYKAFHIIKPRPYPMNEDFKRMKRDNNIPRGEFKSIDPFSGMLPRGFVPPSGSSMCHNNVPESINFFCLYNYSSRP
ncbi:hypothetical protein IHE45_17G062600 [Dioscorea alata]|uniref:Uncharacterized protein n=1 Tax=Dioscorea alata TaxID=55571 RepID=A0ACB7UCL2_DIOAL|nr:hypothetical protein IHE45_17G062600 [Dioscorea alata]